MICIAVLSFGRAGAMLAANIAVRPDARLSVPSDIHQLSQMAWA